MNKAYMLGFFYKEKKIGNEVPSILYMLFMETQ